MHMLLLTVIVLQNVVILPMPILLRLSFYKLAVVWSCPHLNLNHTTFFSERRSKGKRVDKVCTSLQQRLAKKYSMIISKTKATPCGVAQRIVYGEQTTTL